MPKPADDRLRCTHCKRVIKAIHYVYQCDRGHAFPVHRPCRERYLHALLAPPSLKCRSGEGCTIVACRRSDQPDGPQARALLRRSLTILARESAVSRILVDLEDNKMIELHIHFGLNQTWYDVKCKRSEVEARVRAMLDAIRGDAAFKRSVERVVMGWLVGG